MNAQPNVEQRSYEMPPREGMRPYPLFPRRPGTERSARYYEKVLAPAS